MHISQLIKLNFIPDTETKKRLLLKREQKHIVQHIHPVGNNRNLQSRDTHKCSEINHSQNWFRGQYGIRNALQTTARTLVRHRQEPSPRDGEHRVDLPARARISWPWHLTSGHAGPCWTTHSCGTACSFLGARARRGGSCPFAGRFRREQPCPSPASAQGRAPQGRARSCSRPGCEPVQDCCCPISPLPFLPPPF